MKASTLALAILHVLLIYLTRGAWILVLAIYYGMRFLKTKNL